MGHHCGPLFIRHLGDLPVGMQDVDIIEDETALLEPVDLDKTLIGRYAPILPDAAAGVGGHFAPADVFDRAGG